MEDNSCRLAVTFMFEFDEIVGKGFNERGIENLCLIFREMIEDITCQSEHVYDCEVDKEKVDDTDGFPLLISMRTFLTIDKLIYYTDVYNSLYYNFDLKEIALKYLRDSENTLFSEKMEDKFRVSCI